MPLAIMASSGGMCTLVGTPPNITANATLANAGIEVGFFDYALLNFASAGGLHCRSQTQSACKQEDCLPIKGLVSFFLCHTTGNYAKDSSPHPQHI